MSEHYADHGSVLPAGATALIATEDGELTFYLPNGDPEAPVSRYAELLVAVLIRSEDPEWVEEMISMIRDQPEH